MVKKSITPLIVFFLYFAVSIYVTFPLILHLGTGFVGKPMDAFNYVWDIDTFWKEVFLLHNPFHTLRIFYPFGTSLLFHSYSPFISLVTLPLAWNPTIALNAVVLLSPTISSFLSYSLLMDMTKKKSLSVLGGFLYGFSPIMVAFLESQHYQFAFAALFFPAGLLTFFRWKKNICSGKLTALLVLLFWCAFFTEYYSAIMYAFIMGSMMFSSFFFDIHFRATILSLQLKNIRKILLRVAFISLLPIYIIFANLPKNFFASNQPSIGSYSLICSTTISGFFIPSAMSLFLKTASENLRASHPVLNEGDTPSYYIGITMFLLIFFGFFLLKKREFYYPFYSSLLIFTLFSLGKSIHFDANTLIMEKNSFYTFLSSLPFLHLIDCPQRFSIVIEFFLVLLATHTLILIWESRFRWVAFLLSLLLIIEFLPVPNTFSFIPVPRVYTKLGQFRDNKTVLELPSGITESKGAFGYDWSIEALHTKQLYWQLSSHKPRVGGFTSRISPETYVTFQSEPILSDLFTMTSPGGFWTGKVYSTSQKESFIKKFNIRYIVLSPNQRREYFHQIITQEFSQFIENESDIDGYLLITVRDGTVHNL